MYIYICGSDQVSAMHSPLLQITLVGGGGGGTKEKKCVIYVLQRRHFKPKSLKRHDSCFFNVRSDKYSFIN